MQVVTRCQKEKISKILKDEPDDENDLRHGDHEIDLDEIPKAFGDRLGEILENDPFFIEKLRSLFGVFNESDSRHLLEKVNMGQCLYMIDKMQKASKGKMIQRSKK